MSLTNYKIIFKGEICSGFDLAKVKQDIAILFKLDSNKLAKIFSGTEITLKKNISHEQAQKYQDKLQSLGLVVYLEEEEMAFSVVEDTPADLKAMSPIYTPPKIRETTDNQASNIKYYVNPIIEPPAIFSFDFSGRYGRLNYINANIIVSLVLMLSATILSFIPILGWILGIVIFIVLLILDIRIIVLRLHDFGTSGWWFILGFIPIINLILLFMPGTAEENQYGPVPLRGSYAGLIVCIISPFLFGILAGMIYPTYQDRLMQREVQYIYQEISRYQKEVDIALRAGKTPIIGSETSNKDKFYPIKMVEGNVTKSSSNQSQIHGIGFIGLDNTDNNIKIYAVFGLEMLQLFGVRISLHRQADGVWNCIVYSDKQANFKTKYLPKSCKMGN